MTLIVVENDGTVEVTGFAIRDPNNQRQTVTLSAEEGTLTLAQTTGLTFTAGDGTNDATMTFEGKLADVNAAIATLVYDPPDEGFSGLDTITLETSDGNGNSAEATVPIQVTYVFSPILVVSDDTALILDASGTGLKLRN